MTDTKQKPTGDLKNDTRNNSATPPVVLPNSLRLKAPSSIHSRQTMSSILQRLPFIRQINASQNTTLKFQPTWLAWCAQTQKRHGSLALKLRQDASLSSAKQGIIDVACNSTAVASLIKHQQSSLLKAFHNAGFEEIRDIKISMSLSQNAVKTPPKKNTEAKQTLKSSDSAVKSIEATQSLIKNDQLAASLKRLATTLKES